MTLKEQVIEEIDQVPESLMENVLEYLRDLRLKAIARRSPTMMMSEASLAKEWLTPEEDEAWADL